MKKLTVLSVCIALVFCVSLSSSAVASDEEDALQVMENFNQALNTNDYELMTSLFWKSPLTSSFEPSAGSPFLYQGWEAIADDWKSLGEGIYTNVQTLHNPQVVILSDNVAITTVYCNNTHTDLTTNVQSIGQIRQTLVLQKIKGKWLIVHHHASQFPIE